MDWDNLKFFLALAETGSLSRASEKLRVDHSTVSRRIEMLDAAPAVRGDDAKLRRIRLGSLPRKAVTEVSLGVRCARRPRRTRSPTPPPTFGGIMPDFEQIIVEQIGDVVRIWAEVATDHRREDGGDQEREPVHGEGRSGRPQDQQDPAEGGAERVAEVRDGRGQGVHDRELVLVDQPRDRGVDRGLPSTLRRCGSRCRRGPGRRAGSTADPWSR